MKKFLCQCLGGSHMYGLDTPASDTDLRGVYISTDPARVVGLDKNNFFENRAEGADEFYFELRHALSLLRKGNTQVIELLFHQRWLDNTEAWQEIQANKFRLLDSEIMYKCLRGYMQGELQLALGERTGKLGGKRFEQLQKHGFSPKNFTQLYRLGWAGQTFFKEGVFPVHIPTYSSSFHQFLMSVKTKPHDWATETLKVIALENESKLDEAYNNRKTDYKFDLDYANEICVKLYKNVLNGEQIMS